jgi:hypothetical protein
MGRLLAVVAFTLAGCSSQQLYDSAAGWRENECNKILETPRRERCLKEARQSHEEYRRQ